MIKKNFKSSAILASILFMVFYVSACGQTSDTIAAKQENLVRFEHIAFNIPDPAAMAKWYEENLGMKFVRGGFDPRASAFIADSGSHMMIEILHNVDYPVFESKIIHHTSIHFAFNTSDINKIQAQLLGAGAAVSDSLRKTGSGDQVMTLRDPWGLPIQFVERVKPMLDFSGLYPEHFAINVTDSREKTKWYKDNLGMVVIREGSAPGYGMFVADAGKNMMFELYQNKDFPVIDFDTVSYQTFHIAFAVDNVLSVKEALVAAGAKLAEDAKETASGDTVMMLRDPDGLPIQFVKRVNPMLK